MSLTKTTSTLLLVVALFLVAGCGKSGGDSEWDRQKNELGSIYQIYRQQVKKNHRPPTELSDLEQYEIVHALAIRVLREGKYQFVWGVDATEGGAVLAYETEAKEKGGAVLLADGKIQKMSAAQLQTALKGKS